MQNSLESFIVYDFNRGNRRIVLNESITQIKNGENIFSFNEFETIEVEYLGTDYEVTIEASAYKISCEDEIISTENLRLELEPNKKYVISELGNFDIGYNPGTYSISFKHKAGIVILSNFNVYTNQDVSEASISDMVYEIENFLEGLSSDFSKKTINSSEINIADKGQKLLLKSLVDHNKDFAHVCSNLSRNLSANLSNTILKDNKGIKQNSRSIRKSIVKGQTYGVKKIEEISKTCGKLNEYLTRIRNKIQEINIPFEKRIDNYKKDIDKIEEELKSKEAYLNSDIIKGRKRIENQIKDLNSRLASAKKHLNENEIWFEAYKNVSNSVKRLLNLKELKEFDTRITVDTEVFYTDRNFAFVKEFTNLLEGKENNLEDILKNSYALKKTSELFEIYGLILITKTLIKLGYESKFELEDMQELKSGSAFEFINGNKSITLLYDYSCNYYKEASEDEVVFINSHNNKPDYILVYYENDLFKDMKIVEMKYRSLGKIFEQYKTDLSLDITINDYYQLAYKASEETYPIRGVSNVLMLYPSRHETEFTRSFANVIAFNPSLDDDKSGSFILLCNILNGSVND